MNKHKETSWETSASWYDKTVGIKGHYYHQQVILPNLLRLLDFDPKKPYSLLDLACGQGVLARFLPSHGTYRGVDASKTLIASAQKNNVNPKHQFQVADLAKPFTLETPLFTHVTCLLAAQNIENLDLLFQHAASHLQVGGKFICILNHPCFRIPRQSHWEVDDQKKMQYRRVDLYMTPMGIPIQTHPSQESNSPSTLSFHRPLSVYSKALKQAGFLIDQMEEWCSDKQSVGKTASMENRSRREFPLFLAISSIKKG